MSGAEENVVASGLSGKVSDLKDSSAIHIHPVWDTSSRSSLSADSHVSTDVMINLLRVWCVRSEVKSVWLLDCSMRLSMQQLAAVRGLSRLEGVDYEKSYVPYTLQSLLWRHLLVVWTTFLNGLVQCTECCGPLVSDCRDCLVVGFRGSLEIHSGTKGEHEALCSNFD